jgi:phosphate transport system protein
MTMRPREHYVQQLETLHTELRALGQLVIVSITQAIAALRQQDGDSAKQIIANDTRIDQAQSRLEEHAVALMATQQPMARDLRRLVAAIEIASELERIGDYAKGIAKMTVRSAGQPLAKPFVDIPAIAEQGINMLGAALDAYVNEDGEAARKLSNDDDSVDELVSRVRAELITAIQDDPAITPRAVDLLFVTHNLERIADRTTNIAERVIFIDSGDIVELNP